MKMQKRGLPRRDYLLRVHGVSAIINVAIIFELCLIIMSYSYKTRKDSVLSANYLTANEINQCFEYKFDDLWKLYRPFFSKIIATTVFLKHIRNLRLRPER